MSVSTAAAPSRARSRFSTQRRSAARRSSRPLAALPSSVRCLRGQIGCNLQTGLFVFGGELDAQAARTSSNVTTAITPYLAPGGVISIATAQRIDSVGSAAVTAVTAVAADPAASALADRSSSTCRAALPMRVCA